MTRNNCRLWRTLKKLREERGLSARALSRLAGLSPTHVGLIESGVVSNPSAATVAALARALGVTTDRLLS